MAKTFVRFTDLSTGKVSEPTVRTTREANYVFDYAADVATAKFLVELICGSTVLKSLKIGIPDAPGNAMVLSAH